LGLFRKPEPQKVIDPELERQERAAREERISAIRGSVTSRTEELIRAFGARRVLGGSGFGRPPIMGL
jgi:hypothetical protein